VTRYLAAALSIALASGPASALDLGGGGRVGGVGLADVGLGDTEASVGTNGGGSLGVGLGTTEGTGSASTGADTASGTGAATTDANSSTSASKTGGTSASKGASAGKSRSTGIGAVTTKLRAVVTRGFPPMPQLPFALRPRGDGAASRSPADLVAIAGTPRAVVRACSQAIEASAIPYGAKDVRAVSAGSLRRFSHGLVAAPLVVRIRYQAQGVVEVRQARIRCHLDATGRVIAVE
jgi:hypothetical protein